jgi:hypothetical protein
MSNAGRFKIEVSAPHPAWCRLQVDGEEIARLHHNELADLKYTAERAMVEARLKLGDRKDEV